MNGVKRSNDGVVLKRCAFCGGEATLTNQLSKDEYGQRLWTVCCFGCAIRTGSYWDKEIAIEKWNNRKPLERVIERLEERIRILDNTSDINYPSVDVAIKETKRIIEIIKEEMM